MGWVSSVCVCAYSLFIRDFNFTLFLRPPGGADHITDDVETHLERDHDRLAVQILTVPSLLCG